MKEKKNIYNDDILTQSYEKDLPKLHKEILKKHFNEIGYGFLEKELIHPSIYLENERDVSRIPYDKGIKMIIKNKLLDDFFNNIITDVELKERIEKIDDFINKLSRGNKNRVG